jgi:hypothetical protein
MIEDPAEMVRVMKLAKKRNVGFDAANLLFLVVSIVVSRCLTKSSPLRESI